MTATRTIATEIKQENSHALAFNTVALGLAASTIFNPLIGACCMVANVALSLLNDLQLERDWLPLNGRVIEQLKDYWKNSSYFFIMQIFIGIFLAATNIILNQRAILWLRGSLSSPLTALYVIFRICVVAPLAEEIVFRGFIQDKIRSIQHYFFKEEADTEVQTVARVGLQALLFGLMHYHPSQGMMNIFLVVSTGYMGFRMGTLREETKNIWSSLGYHTHLNSSVTARVMVFGT